jgi:hypothetical protein
MFTKEFYHTHWELISNVDNKIESLNNDDKRKLMSLIRSQHVMEKETLERSLEFVKLNGIFSKRVAAAKIIIALYEKAGCIEEDWQHHWSYYKSVQHGLHINTKKMTKPARQDNKTFINRGSGGTNANKIRFPKKVRKTAWKRFYKLFPHLKPKEA